MRLKRLLAFWLCVYLTLVVTGHEIKNSALNSHEKRSLDAPAQIKTFEFLIGEHTCEDELIAPDGTVTHIQGHWSGHYILNGKAIQDHYWNDQYAATNIRIFDPNHERWLVTYFRFPGYRTGVWEGDKEGDKIAFRRTFTHNGENVVSELIFENISQSGFYWSSRYISSSTELVNWTSDCKREGA